TRDAEAARKSSPHVRNLLVEVPRHVAQRREKRAIPVGAVVALPWCETRPEEGVAVERRLVGTEAHLVRQRAQRRLEHLRVDLFLGRELVERNRLQFG